MNTILMLAYALLGAAFLICVIYASARAAATAWYKTKLEHLKRVLNITKNGEL